MPKRKGETDQDWMERVRAARCYLNSRNGSEASALAGFMAIFHPDYPEDKVRQMVQEKRKEG